MPPSLIIFCTIWPKIKKGGGAISPIFGLKIWSKIKHGIYQISTHLLKVEEVCLLKTNVIFKISSVTLTTIHLKNSLSMTFLNFLQNLIYFFVVFASGNIEHMQQPPRSFTRRCNLILYVTCVNILVVVACAQCF